MAFSFVSSDTTVGSNSAAVAVNAAIQNGDLLFGFVVSLGAAVSAVPAGWTQIGSDLQTGTRHAALFWKVANGESGSYTWNAGSSGTTRATVTALRGENSAVPIDQAAGQLNSTGNTANPSPSLTLANAGDMLFYAATPANSSETFTAPTGFTIPTNGQGNGAVVAYNLSAQPAGATGSVSATGSASNASLVYLAGVNAAGVGGGGAAAPIYPVIHLGRGHRGPHRLR